MADRSAARKSFDLTGVFVLARGVEKCEETSDLG